MRVVKKQNGSITIFSLLVLSLVLGCLLTLLEGTRIHELRKIARLRTELAVEATFASYNTALWETYHLLGCNQEEMQGLITTSANGGYSEFQYGSNLLLLELKSVDVQSYTLLTDANGAAYINAVSAYMSNNILYEVAKGIYNQYESIKNLLDSEIASGNEVEEALESLDASKETSGWTTRQTGDENLLESIQRIQKTQLLELVMEDTSILSKKEFDLDKSVSERELRIGKNSKVEENNWLDRVLLQQYLLTYLSDYTNEKEGRGLSYELEYLIGGKDNDIENLRTVVNQLLLIREAANLVYLFADAEKVQEAYLLALALAGVTVNPAIIEVVKIGLLAAWAFAESVLDVRALLQGKNIPLIKSKESWTLALENIGSISQGYMTAKESKVGISYKTYLGILVLFQGDRELAYRAMDMQETTMQKSIGNIQMDQMVVNAQVQVTYKYAPIFMSLKKVDETRNWSYLFSEVASYGYY